MHVGVTLPMSGIPAAARLAEDCGLDGICAGDHLVSRGPVLDSAMALAAAAAATSRVTVGWSVLLPALRQQAWEAKQIASLQHLSAGRVQLRVGVGNAGLEWAAAGVPTTGRGTRTDLMLAALPGLLAGRPTVLATEPDRPAVTLAPAAPTPPLWIGRTSDAARRREQSGMARRVAGAG